MESEFRTKLIESLDPNTEVINDRLGERSNPECSLKLFESLDPNMKAINDMLASSLMYFLSFDCLLVLSLM